MRLAKKPRSKGLGGSEAAAVLGLNPYDSPMDVWLHKTLTVPSDFRENRYTRWGKLKEPVVAKNYAEVHGCKLVWSPRRVHRDHPWFLGTPDRLIEAPEDEAKRAAIEEKLGPCIEDPVSKRLLVRRGLEIKTGLAKHAAKWGETWKVIENLERARMHPVPVFYWVQCQWYMELMGFEEWDLVVLLDSSDFREYRVLRDPEWMSVALKTCERFWFDHVKPRVPPPVDWGRSVNKYLDSLFPEHSDVIRVADLTEDLLAKEFREVSEVLTDLYEQRRAAAEELANAEANYLQLKQRIDSLYKKESHLKNVLRARIGADKGLQTKEGVILWKNSSDTTKTRRMTKNWNPAN